MQNAAKKNNWLPFKEPLFSFFLLGVIVFGLHAYLKTASTDNERFHVEITSSDVDWLRTRWAQQMGSEPTEDETQSLIDSLIREEILYREAVAKGLDEKDSVIRRQLAQKMEYLLEDITELQPPTDQQLKNYFIQHQDRYRIDAEFSFNHVVFSDEKHPRTARADAAAVLDQFREQNIPLNETASFGDTTVLPVLYQRKTPDQIATIFGEHFFDTIQSLKPNQWAGPIQSNYGWHLVYLRERMDSRLPDFELVRSTVQTDYLSEQRTVMNQQAYDKLASQYTIYVEDLPYESQRKQ